MNQTSAALLVFGAFLFQLGTIALVLVAAFMSGSFFPPTGDGPYITPTLLNSYTTFSGLTPGYRKTGRLVICRGVLTRTNPVSAETIFNLPAEFRQTSGVDLFFSCTLSADAVYRPGFFSVSTNGDVKIFLPQATTTLLVYLSAIIFEAGI